MYTIVGYDKDNDVYVVIEDGYSLSIEAKNEARQYAAVLKTGNLRRGDNGEPFDWIEVYREYGTEEETMVWASYDEED